MALAHTIKVQAATLLCHPLVGRSLRRMMPTDVPNDGCVFDTRDPAVSDSAVASIFWGFYESAERRFVRKHLRSDLDVVELGSSLGVVSSHVAHKLEPGRKLVCVEANPALVPSLRSNVALNSQGLDVRFETAAIAYGVDTVDFELGEEAIASRVATAGSTGGRKVRAPAVTLSALLAKHGIGDYALVMDIEGAEAAILAEDAPALARCRQVVAELHATTHAGQRYTVDDLVARFAELGLVVTDRHGPVVVLTRT